MRSPGIAQQTNLSASRRNIPVSVFAEVTRRCNINCYYCYQKSQKAGDELPLSRWESLMHELAGAGALYIAFSGGEPFLRKDFLSIVGAARQNDFAVSIISNGSLIDKPTVQSLLELGVMDVGISFLAGDAATHDRLAGQQGGFDRALNAVKLLGSAGVKVIIKHSVSSENFGHYRLLEKLAGEENCIFEADGSILPSIQDEISRYALSEEQQKIFLQDMGIRPFQSCRSPADQKTSENNAFWALHCDAGRSMCAISSSGDVYPCIILPISFGSIKNKQFLEVWNGAEADQFRESEKKLEQECEGCQLLAYCSRCHAVASMETGNWRGKSPGLCGRANALKRLSGEKNSVGDKSPY